jgi:Ca-activated chloride channel homolog
MPMSWGHPWALALLLLLPLHALWLRRQRPAALPLPRAESLRDQPRERLWSALGHAPAALRALAIVVLVLALARPRTPGPTGPVAEGVPIAIAIDISSSMLAEDFAPANRMEVARRATRDFVAAREGDPVALVAFAGEAITLAPLTTDRRVLFGALDGLQVGLLEDGTAIGMGLATAASRLEHVPGESKVVVLLSDGENNRGEIAPLEAGAAAAALGIRVFTIGVGNGEAAPVPLRRGPDGRVIEFAEAPVGIDEPLLREIARLTGGEYFRADNPRALDEVYARLDRMVAVPVETPAESRPREWYLPLVLLGGLLLAGEWLLRGSRWGRMP